MIFIKLGMNHHWVNFGRNSSQVGRCDWYCLLFMQTHNISLDYLQEVYDFMVAHPEEVIVVWFSFHGGAWGATYPLATQKDMNNYWNSVTTLFNGMMFDTRRSQMNITTIGELMETNQRVIVYISITQLLQTTPYAMDSCEIDNQLPENFMTILSIQMSRMQTTKNQIGLV